MNYFEKLIEKIGDKNIVTKEVPFQVMKSLPSDINNVITMLAKTYTPPENDIISPNEEEIKYFEGINEDIFNFFKEINVDLSSKKFPVNRIYFPKQDKVNDYLEEKEGSFYLGSLFINQDKFSSKDPISKYYYLCHELIHANTWIKEKIYLDEKNQKLSLNRKSEVGFSDGESAILLTEAVTDTLAFILTFKKFGAAPSNIAYPNYVKLLDVLVLKASKDYSMQYNEVWKIIFKSFAYKNKDFIKLCLGLFEKDLLSDLLCAKDIESIKKLVVKNKLDNINLLKELEEATSNVKNRNISTSDKFKLMYKEGLN